MRNSSPKAVLCRGRGDTAVVRYLYRTCNLKPVYVKIERESCVERGREN